MLSKADEYWIKVPETGRVWWVNDGFLSRFSFDKKKEYNLFDDYPHNLTEQERGILESDCNEVVEGIWYKDNPNDKIWRKDLRDRVGEHVFSFDKKKEYNLFRDYPHNLTE